MFSATPITVLIREEIRVADVHVRLFWKLKKVLLAVLKQNWNEFEFVIKGLV